MKWFFGKTAAWLWITVATAAVALAAGQNIQLPEGDGKKILESGCTGCHDLGAALKYQGVYKQQQWQELVTTMVGYGAMVDEKQVPVLVDYLTKNFGPKDAGPAPAPAQAEAGKEHPGKKVLEASCLGCHGLDTVARNQLNKDGWQTVVENMIGYGATVSKEDVPALVEYLAQTYPSK